MPRLTVLLLLVSLTIGCVSGPSRNQSPEKYSFDCDVPAGHYSAWTRSIDASSLQVSGKLQLLEVREDPKWAPGANIELVNAQGSDAVGFQLAVFKRNPGQISAFLHHQQSAEPRVLIATPDWNGNIISFDLALSKAGVVTATLNGMSQAIPLGTFRPNSVRFTCSTGQFNFSEVTIASESH